MSEVPRRPKTRILAVLAACALAAVGGALLRRNLSISLQTNSPFVGETATPGPFSGPVRAPGGAGSGPGVPQFRDGVEPDRLVPGTARYNPSALADFLGLTGLFEQEERNDSWARTVESNLPPLLLNDTARVVPGLRIAAIQCKTTMCKISWTAPEERRERVKAILKFLVPGARSGIRPGTEESGENFYVTFAGGYGPFRGSTASDPETTLKMLQDLRVQTFGRFRLGNYGRIPVPAGIAPSDWPIR
jgi:hypothetical protein